MSAAGYTLFWTEANPGDFNGDGAVSGLDLFLLASRFNQESNFNGNLATSPGNDCIDGNQDGILNGMDLFVISVNYNSRVTGYNLYKSANQGETWSISQTSPIPRQIPAAANCRDLGMSIEAEDVFEQNWYRVSMLDGQDESDKSEVLQTIELETPTMEAVKLTGEEQVIVDPFGMTVHLPAGVSGDGEQLSVGVISNLPGTGEVPTLGRCGFVAFGAAPGADYTVRMPFLPRDIFGMDSQDLGLMLYSEETKNGGTWDAVDQADFDVVETSPGEGYVEYSSMQQRLVMGLYTGGDLSCEIQAEVMNGFAPLPCRFSCDASGGVFPYTYTWSIGGDEQAPLASNLFEYEFGTAGTYEVSCTVKDSQEVQAYSPMMEIEVAEPTFTILGITADQWTFAPNTDMDASLEVQFENADGVSWDWEILTGSAAFVSRNAGPAVEVQCFSSEREKITLRVTGARDFEVHSKDFNLNYFPGDPIPIGDGAQSDGYFVNYVLEDLVDESMIDLGADCFSRSDVVLIEFWADWEIWGKQDFPRYQSCWEDYAKDGFTMLFIAEDDSIAAPQSYVASHPEFTPDWWLWGYPSEVFETYRIDELGLPQTMIFDRDGYQRYRRTGAWTEVEMRAVIEDLL